MRQLPFSGKMWTEKEKIWSKNRENKGKTIKNESFLKKVDEKFGGTK